MDQERLTAPGTSDPYALAGQEMSPEEWSYELLARLASPLSEQNALALGAWVDAEAGHWGDGYAFNPLNARYVLPGTEGFPAASGPQCYASWEEGLRATLAQLRDPVYMPLRSALDQGDDAVAVIAAITASPWGTDTARLASAWGAAQQRAADSSDQGPGRVSAVGAAAALAAFGFQEASRGPAKEPLNVAAPPQADGSAPGGGGPAPPAPPAAAPATWADLGGGYVAPPPGGPDEVRFDFSPLDGPGVMSGNDDGMWEERPGGGEQGDAAAVDGQGTPGPGTGGPENGGPENGGPENGAPENGPDAVAEDDFGR
ncbi:MAG TPA: hypothetical protein VME46_13660 [Acidimicrobiales bacterium]|nr:hypothetical protein [Acidimicrobiales bacterium]